MFMTVRMDQHNLVDKLVFSPRASLLYKLKTSTQFRFSYGTGFRAPQAFDTDLHIAFAGGGISRISLSPELERETSRSFTLNYIFTGTMKVPHFAGAPNQVVDEIFTSDSFSELSVKVGHKIPVEKLGNQIEFYGGIKNIFNAYQDDFDLGKNRDSNYIYGPAQPRTFFLIRGQKRTTRLILWF